MKKQLLKSAMIALAGVGLMAGSAMALTYSETKILNATLSESIIYTLAGYSDTYSYYHSTPADFEVPYDIVSTASLTIAGNYINGNNDPVYVEGVYQGVLSSVGVLSWTQSSTSTFDIASMFTVWANGSDLNVLIDANGIGEGRLVLNSSTFTLNYNNGSAPSPVPEPATMLLFGTGLAGIAGVSRRKAVRK